ncbi:MAG TPA: hypothetical protein VMT46_04135, partial [Anaerolineaceae bacterium]|nr:hypothetical protein [Anaerolineaceae bacterium]
MAANWSVGMTDLQEQDSTLGSKGTSVIYGFLKDTVGKPKAKGMNRHVYHRSKISTGQSLSLPRRISHFKFGSKT